MLGGGLGEVDVQVLAEIGDRDARMPGQHAGDLGDRGVEAGDVGVDLDAVAGRQRQHFADRVVAVQFAEHLRQVLGRDARALEHGHRRRAVGQADHKQAHRATSLFAQALIADLAR